MEPSDGRISGVRRAAGGVRVRWATRPRAGVSGGFAVNRRLTCDSFGAPSVRAQLAGSPCFCRAVDRACLERVLRGTAKGGSRGGDPSAWMGFHRTPLRRHGAGARQHWINNGTCQIWQKILPVAKCITLPNGKRRIQNFMIRPFVEKQRWTSNGAHYIMP